ncbi:MAG: aspartate--tRNA ligase [Flammeovirgaceae bacterium]|nr:aspartate--tRNA ligase [Flammeovirgaceae bacterium]
MLRTHTCGELRKSDVGHEVTLAGWVQRIRDKGSLLWIDLRDRYGITQLFLEDGKSDKLLVAKVRELGREYVIQITGTVTERSSKNDKIPTGEIEVVPSAIEILNTSKVPPFTIEDNTDGGDDLRMKYRYIDLRRKMVADNLHLRHKMAQQTRSYLDSQNFIEVETPVLIKSTPEGARDFVVPSRMNEGEFYALPQSPQTFKQLLMVSGFDRYYQIVRCFRDEDLRADRQPEFTQIDCEMAFVTQEDVLNTFEGLIRHLFKKVKNIEIPPLPRMSFQEAMEKYGSDKPDTRFGMEFCDFTQLSKGKNFQVFDQAEIIIGINATGCASYTRKQLDELTDFVRKPQIGAKGLVYIKYETDGSIKSSVDKFYTNDDLKSWMETADAKPGDLILVLAGETRQTRNALNELRLLMGDKLGLRDHNTFNALWVIDFPLLEWSDDTKRFHAMHHPFTSPKKEDIKLLDSDPAKVRANAYDMVINGTEVGGGSIRIHDRATQQLMFRHLGFSEEEAKQQFGFLLDAFEFGAPPHGGIAFGFDRLCSLFGGSESIRDFIAFPKNNAGRDVMIDTPSAISQEQLDELKISVKKK